MMSASIHIVILFFLILSGLDFFRIGEKIKRHVLLSLQLPFQIFILWNLFSFYNTKMEDAYTYRLWNWFPKGESIISLNLTVDQLFVYASALLLISSAIFNLLKKDKDFIPTHLIGFALLVLLTVNELIGYSLFLSGILLIFLLQLQSFKNKIDVGTYVLIFLHVITNLLLIFTSYWFVKNYGLAEINKIGIYAKEGLFETDHLGFDIFKLILILICIQIVYQFIDLQKKKIMLFLPYIVMFFFVIYYKMHQLGLVINITEQILISTITVVSVFLMMFLRKHILFLSFLHVIKDCTDGIYDIEKEFLKKMTITEGKLSKTNETDDKGALPIDLSKVFMLLIIIFFLTISNVVSKL